MISYKLRKEYGITVDPLDLMSMFEEETVSEDLQKKIDSFDDYFEEFYKKVTIIDSISNPYGIYKYIREYSRDNGVHHYYNFIESKGRDKVGIITEKEYSKLDKEKQKEYAYYGYKANNSDEYVICIVDHMSLLQEEKGKTLHQAMTDMSATYGRKQITKHFNYIFIGVQQQTGGQEELAFTNGGKKIIEKLKPALSGLADNKTTQRDAHVVLGLFAPNRYNIEDYNGYNIEQLDDNYRSLIILKNRLGKGNMEVPLYYNGAVTQFRELPKEMRLEDYDMIEKATKSLKNAE